MSGTQYPTPDNRRSQRSDRRLLAESCAALRRSYELLRIAVPPAGGGMESILPRGSTKRCGRGDHAPRAIKNP